MVNELENSNDKLSIFADKDKLNNCSELSYSDLVGLVRDFLTDEQKVQLFKFEHFTNTSSHVKSRIILSISDSTAKLKLITNDEIMSGVDGYNALEIVQSLDESDKVQILKNVAFLEKYEIRDYEIEKIILSLGDEAKTKLVLDTELMQNQFNLEKYAIRKNCSKQ